MGTRNLDKLFSPRSVAVVGASPKEGSAGKTILANLINGGFKGSVFPINPNYQEILGLAAYPDIGSLAERVELAVIAVKIGIVPEILKRLGEAEVPAAIIVAVGGSEAGVEGKRIEEDVLKEAKKSGIRVLGPNSLGIICPHQHLNVSLARHNAIEGQVAFVSQSGALSYAILDRSFMDGLGFSHFISIGNMADVDFGDVIDYLSADPNVRSIILYLENLRDFRGFMSSARAVSRRKPIIALKAGISSAGAMAAASHTGAMTSEDSVYDAAFQRAGIIRVTSVAELFDCARALAQQPHPRGSRLAVVTNAGAPGVMAMDAISRWGEEPARLSKETLGKLDAILPASWSRRNPVDILGDASPRRYLEAVELLMKDPDIDGLVVILTPQFMTRPEEVAELLAGEFHKRTKPLFAVWMGFRDVERGIEILKESKISNHESPERAVNAFMHMVSHAKNRWLLMETPPTMPRDLSYNHSLAEAIIDRALETECHMLTETESKAVLSAYGIPVNPTEIANSPESAAAAAASLGFPVALKVLSREVSHKTDVDGVRLDLNDEGEVRRAYEAILESVTRELPQAQIEGVTVQNMVENPDHELIVGATFDRGFGPILLFGAGGVAVNFLEDRAIELPPLNRLLARRFMEKTRIFKLLKGVRGIASANLVLIEEILIRLSLLVTDFPEIRELDINPLVAKGDIIMAVDARVVVAPKMVTAPLHLSISPYPNQYESNWVTGDGTPVLLRPIRPEDEPLMKELLESLSGHSSYLRFFKTLKEFSHEWLAHVTQIDYDRELAMVAITQPPFKERILGESRLIHELTGESAEFAIIVGDRWQGKGLGRKLLEVLIGIARERGIRRVNGFIMPENKNMIKLCEKLGFHKSYDRNLGTHIVEIEL